MYAARDTVIAAERLNLAPITTPARSPQSNGRSEAFVHTLRRDDIAGADLAAAAVRRGSRSRRGRRTPTPRRRSRRSAISRLRSFGLHGATPTHLEGVSRIGEQSKDGRSKSGRHANIRDHPRARDLGEIGVSLTLVERAGDDRCECRVLKWRTASARCLDVALRGRSRAPTMAAPLDPLGARPLRRYRFRRPNVAALPPYSEAVDTNRLAAGLDTDVGRPRGALVASCAVARR